MEYEQTIINQVANLTYLEYLDNIKISDSDPKDYYSEIKEKYYKGKEYFLEEQLDNHGIPRNFYELDYNVFLNERRKNISRIIRNLYDSI